MARPVYYTPIKRSHLLTPFSVGSILLSRNGVSVVVAGLQAWLDDRPDHDFGRDYWLTSNQVIDRRLCARLGVPRLIAPPALADEPNHHNTWYVKVVRFPLSEYCINPKCRRMITREPDDVANGACTTCEKPGRKGKWPTQQIPLVLACQHGHLSDIPWVEWAHTPGLRRQASDGFNDEPVQKGHQPSREVQLCSNPVLTYRVSSDVTTPSVSCETCGASIDLGEIRSLSHPCPGERPWLPGTAAQDCDQDAQLLERTATNLIYPNVMSALHIPAGPTLDHRLIAFLTSAAPSVLLRDVAAGEAPDARTCQQLVDLAALRGIVTNADGVAMHAIEIGQPEPDSDSDVRTIELDVLLRAEPSTSTAVGLPPLVVEAMSLDPYSPPWFTGPNRRVSAVRAVHRLAETRVLTGFSRIQSRDQEPEAGFETLWGNSLDAAKARDWLPAHRVYGEGILLRLDEEAVDHWLQANKRHAQWGDVDAPASDGWTPRHWLVHSLAHVLLREAAAVCGYSLPSLRERLYVDEHDGERRTALLIYTAEGDIHGTLGGLVELAQPGRLEALLSGALDHARWCGADPVCLNPIEGAGLITTPGCCHHCLLVPETTCEHFNKQLDRAALIGGRDHATGFFEERWPASGPR